MSPVASPKPAKTVVILCLLFVNKTVVPTALTRQHPVFNRQYCKVPKELGCLLANPTACWMPASLSTQGNSLLSSTLLQPWGFASLLPASLSYITLPIGPCALLLLSLLALSSLPLHPTSHHPLSSHCPIPDVSGCGPPHICNKKPFSSNISWSSHVRFHSDTPRSS